MKRATARGLCFRTQSRSLASRSVSHTEIVSRSQGSFSRFFLAPAPTASTNYNFNHSAHFSFSTSTQDRETTNAETEKDPLKTLRELIVPTKILTQGEIAKLVPLLEKIDKEKLTEHEWSRVLSIFNRNQRSQDAHHVVDTVLKQIGVPTTHFLFNEIAKVWRSPQQMEALFKEMKAKGVALKEEHYTMLIRAFAMGEDLVRAEEIYAHAVETGIMKPNFMALKVLGLGYLKVKRIQAAFEIFQLMKADKITPLQEDFHSALILALIRTGKLDAAQEVLSDLVNNKIGSVIAYTHVISGLGRTGNYEDARRLFLAMEAAGVKPDVIVYNALIYACIQTGDLNEGLALLDEMKRKHLIPKVDTYNVLLTGYVKAQLMTEAMALFEEMSLSTNKKPDSHTYAVLLAGVGTYLEAKALFARMAEHNVQPGTVHYNILIDFCAKERRLDTAFELAALLEQQQAADMITYTSLFSACLLANEPDRAMEVFQRFRETQKAAADGKPYFKRRKSDGGSKGILADEQCYGLMMEVCLNYDRFDEALHLLSEMVSQETLHPTDGHLQAYRLLQEGNTEKAIDILKQLELRHQNKKPTAALQE